jgi:uncharacterized protein YukJ
MNPIIFLDHDGVICLQQQWGTRYKDGTTFDKLDKKAVIVLNDILSETDADIVVSSDWRFEVPLAEMKRLYIDWGIIKEPIAYTQSYADINESYKNRCDKSPTPAFYRAMEILSYAEVNGIENWVAVDDLNLSPDVGMNAITGEFSNRWRLKDRHFVHTPRVNEGIKQTGIKDKIIQKIHKGCRL